MRQPVYGSKQGPLYTPGDLTEAIESIVETDGAMMGANGETQLYRKTGQAILKAVRAFMTERLRGELNRAEKERVSDWLRGGDVKAPALAVAGALLSPRGLPDDGVTAFNPWPYPVTMQQFTQCRLLLGLVPAHQGAVLNTLKEKSRVWGRLALRWDEMNGIADAGGDGYQDRICGILAECADEA